MKALITLATETILALLMPGLATAQNIQGETRVFDGMEFVWIPPGDFDMGSTSSEARPNEQPVTFVRISEGFWLGKYEVTQAEWLAVMEINPSEFVCDRCPVERVSWNLVQSFLHTLNGRCRCGNVYRLPTEAEWEYAARARTEGDRYGDVDAIAWYGEGYGGRSHPVGQKESNDWGLHDMLGNVWEWVQDWYGEYPGGFWTDYRGPDTGSHKVRRGGGLMHHDAWSRASARVDVHPSVAWSDHGFRLLRMEN